MKNKIGNKEIELDTRGLECPIPVLKARKLSHSLNNGDTVKVICTDPLAELDFQHYCEQSKYRYIECNKIEGYFVIKYQFISDIQANKYLKK